MKLQSITLILLILIGHSSVGQKIKYKDLFPLLDAKNYEEGGPKLMQYLSDPKNAEDANAHLQMGLMLEHQYLQFDVIDDSSKIYAKGDSAVFYFETAKTLINEKELKKHDEYYQAFFRRDLRTGEFGIKVSDVHLDIEKKVESVKTRSANVKEINQKIRAVERNYLVAQGGYERLVGKYSEANDLLLSASDEDQ